MNFFRTVIIVVGFIIIPFSALAADTPRVSLTGAPTHLIEGDIATVTVHLVQPIIIDHPEYLNPDFSISLTSSNPGALTISPSTITYNVNEWSIPKTFTITAVDNNTFDGLTSADVTLSVVSGSEFYNGYSTSFHVNLYDDEDIVGPVLTVTKKIRRKTTAEDAILKLTTTNEGGGPIHCALSIDKNSKQSHIVVHGGTTQMTFSGLEIGGVYAASTYCEDYMHNRSNTISTGAFEVVPNYQQTLGSLPQTEKQTVSPVFLPTISIRLPNTVLHLGQTNSDVKTLQQLLNKNGISVSSSGDGSSGSETDYFGMKTLQAVKIFQKQSGLEIDGMVGAKTWELLNK